MEYRLIIQPHEDVRKRIQAVKNDFADEYKCNLIRWAKPHMTVMNFFAKQEVEGLLMHCLTEVINEQQRFKIFLNNYGSAPDNDVFIRVQHHESFLQLQQALTPITKYIHDSDNLDVRKIPKPYFSIVRKLKASVYRKAIFDYSQKLFKATFIVSELLLLKRDAYYNCFEQVGTYNLANV